MIFQKITKPDNESLKAFTPNRKNFIYKAKSSIKQLKRIIDTSIAFYKVFDNQKFIGCLFVDCINEKEKVIEFGGFALRHVNTCMAIKELISFIKYHYPDYKIKALTKELSAKISLINAGLTNIKGDYYYE